MILLFIFSAALYVFCEAHWVALLYEMCYINQCPFHSIPLSMLLRSYLLALMAPSGGPQAVEDN